MIPFRCVCPRSHESQNFYLFKILRAHILPLTNCAFNKSGDRFITGSYDRTCKVWNTLTGEELLTLEGHKNVVYAIAFNNPFGDKIVTGSFDKTAKLWSADTGELLHTLKGHATEIVSPPAVCTRSVALRVMHHVWRTMPCTMCDAPCRGGRCALPSTRTMQCTMQCTV